VVKHVVASVGSAAAASMSQFNSAGNSHVHMLWFALCPSVAQYASHRLLAAGTSRTVSSSNDMVLLMRVRVVDVREKWL
jgi:hypothetical protein